jgi:hypothetical protein
VHLLVSEQYTFADIYHHIYNIQQFKQVIWNQILQAPSLSPFLKRYIILKSTHLFPKQSDFPRNVCVISKEKVKVNVILK